MKKVVLHVGHGKTGTSYLQSCFAINREKLLEFDINYPIHGSDKSAISGEITSGNGMDFLKTLPGMEVTNESILFSNERLFHTLLVSDEFKVLLNSKDYLFEVMLYTRNLFELMFSVWQQQVKSTGFNQDLETYLMGNTKDPHHLKVLSWVELSKEYNFKLRIRNYSRHKNDIAPQFFADLLGVEDFVLATPKAKRVNRSLTYPELNFQRVFNSLAIKSPPISNLMVNRFPNIQASKIKCSRKVYDFIKDENVDLIASINKYLDSDEAVEIEPPEMVTFGEDEVLSDHLLSNDQINVIAEYLFKHCKPENNNQEEEINEIRDVALKISKNSADLNDALNLMRIALRKRPGGKGMQDIVRKWEQDLADD